MAVAPFQLLVDLAAVGSGVRSGSTVTVTTTATHNLVTGDYVEVGAFTGTPGTSMNGMFQVTVTSGTAFTYTAAGSAGTATVGSAYISRDIANPLINYSTASRDTAAILSLDNFSIASSADGGASTATFAVEQFVTPGSVPWWKTLPDNTRVRLCLTTTGSTATAAQTVFRGVVTGVNVQLSGSGVGNRAEFTCEDSSAVLSRLIIGQQDTKRAISTITRTSNVTTVTTAVAHGFSTGNSVAINGVTGTGFNGSYSITKTGDTTFTYANTGSNATGGTALSISNIAFSTVVGCVEITTSVAHGLKNDYVVVSGVTGTAGLFVNGSYSTSAAITIVSTTVIRLRVPALPSSGTFSYGSATVTSLGICNVVGATTGIALNVSSVSEADAVKGVLNKGLQNDALQDAYLMRLFDPSIQTQISGYTYGVMSGILLQIPVGTLQGALETIREAYIENDSLPRRYYIRPSDAALVYERVSTPTFPTAPLEITTDAVGSPDTTVAAGTINPYDLKVDYDHSGVIKRLRPLGMQGADIAGVRTYNDANIGYATRTGPLFESSMEMPAVRKTGGYTASAKAAFIERYQPQTSGSFTLRGTGDAAFNVYGFTAGYAQTGASTYALVTGWLAGQWVKITSSGLGLSGLYRIEEVTYSLEPGTTIWRIDVAFSRKNLRELSTKFQKKRE